MPKKTHIRRESWMTPSRYNEPTVCSTIYGTNFEFEPPEQATCGSCLRIWLWESWRAGKLKQISPL